MKSIIWVGVVSLVCTGVAGAQHKHKKLSPKPVVTKVSPSKGAWPKEENKFITVEEFRHAKRGAGSAVSVEGYEVIVFPTGDGGLHLSIVDSVDHVLSASDANAFAQGGCVGLVSRSAIQGHPRWSWTSGSMKKFAMYTGPGSATKNLHDVVEKMRFTGWTTGGRATINVTKIEFMDANGDWKVL